MNGGAGGFDTSLIVNEKAIRAERVRGQQIADLQMKVQFLENTIKDVAQIAIGAHIYTLQLTPMSELRRYAKDLSVESKGLERQELIDAIMHAEAHPGKPNPFAQGSEDSKKDPETDTEKDPE